jgi:multiple sugar transport system permease protein
MAVSTGAHLQRHRRLNHGYVFVLPYVLFLLVFGVGPALYAIFLCFVDTSGNSFQFNGLANFVAVFRDFRFAPAFGHVFLFLIIWLPVTVIGVLLLALLLHARIGRFSSTMRLIYYLPGAVTGSASVLLWLFMFDPQISPFALVLHAFGFKVLANAIDAAHLPFLLTVIAFSTGAGGWIVIMYGALQNISHEIMEASTIDGCNPIQAALYIKLPLIVPYVVYMLILSFAGGVQLFVEPQLIGAASHGAITPTWSPNELSYDYAFNVGNLGASAAISMVLLVISLIGALLIIFKSGFFRSEISKG